jgi:hypothetical protein
MTDYIVTIKLPKDPLHDPSNKKSGKCLVSTHCTDVTGAHHSTLLRDSSASVDQVLAKYEELGVHVTRIETVDY